VSDDKRYNGWSNYETWNVKLWMDNDEGSYHYWQEETESILTREQDKDAATGRLADVLKTEHQDNAPELQGTYADLLGAALSEVDWYEIAESLVSDALEANPDLIEQEAE